MPLIELTCRRIPRSAIRFFNSILVARAIFESVDQGEESSDVPLVAFAVDRLLQLVWTDVHAALIASETLCAVVLQWKSATPSGAIDVINRIAQDEVLRELLQSHPGLEWLRHPNWRRATSMFLVTRREREESTQVPLGYGSSSASPFQVCAMPGKEEYLADLANDGRLDTEKLEEYLWSCGWGTFVFESRSQLGSLTGDARDLRRAFQNALSAVLAARPFLPRSYSELREFWTWLDVQLRRHLQQSL
jgi:hypothetical protein